MPIYTLEDLRSAVPASMRGMSDEELVRDYSKRLGESYDTVATDLGLKPRGTLSEMGRQAVGGAVVDLPKMVGQGLQYTGIAPEYGREMAQAAEARAPGYQPDMRGRGVAAEALISGARGLAPVLATAPLAFVPGGQVAAPAAAAVLFGTSSAQETFDKLVSQGIPEDEAAAAARRVGMIQGPLEGIATAVGMRAARPLTTALGRAGTTAGVAGALTETGVAAPFLKGLATNMVVQPATEVAQDVGTSMVERAYGAAPEDLGAIARQSALGGIGLTALLGPLALGSHVSRSRRAEVLKDALYGENTDPAVRSKAMDIVMTEARRQGVGEQDIGQWFNSQIKLEEARNEALRQAEEQQKIEERNAQIDLMGKEAQELPGLQGGAFGSLEQQRAVEEGMAGLNIPQPFGSLEQQQLVEQDLTRLRDERIAGVGQQYQDLEGQRAAGLMAAQDVGQQAQEVMAPQVRGLQAAQEVGGQWQELQADNKRKLIELDEMGQEWQKMQAELPQPVTGKLTRRQQQALRGPTGKGAIPGVSPITPQPESQMAPRTSLLPQPAVSSQVPAPAPAAPSSLLTERPQPEAPVGSPPPGAESAVTPVAPVVTGALSADETKSLQRILDAADSTNTGKALPASVTGPSTVKAPGRTSLNQIALANIRDSLVQGKEAATEQANAIVDALRNFAESYNAYSTLGGNVFSRRNKLPKKQKTIGQYSDEQISALQLQAANVQAALAELGTAVGGNAKDVEAVVRLVKDLVQGKLASKGQQRGVSPEIKSLETMLSQAWAAAKREAFMTEQPDMADIRGGEIRVAREQTGKPSPLETAAVEGVGGLNKKAPGEKVYGLAAVMNYLRNHGTPFERMLAGTLRDVLLDQGSQTKLEFIDEGNSRYDPRNDTVYLHRTASPEVSLHEALHAALQSFIYKNPKDPMVMQLKKSLKDVVNYKGELTGKAKEVQDLLKKLVAEKNELDAVLELVSYGTTLNDFRKALQAMPTKGVPQSFRESASKVWQYIKAVMARMLGKPNTVAGDVLDTTLALLERATKVAPEKGQGNVLNAADVKGKTINVDGVSRPMENSKGQPIFSTEEGIRNFWRWFGNSKVVDKQGRPLVVYHGTNKDFAEFKTKNSGMNMYGEGAYFTSDTGLADKFAVEDLAEKIRGRDAGNPVVYPAYLRIEKPGVDGEIIGPVFLVKSPEQIKSSVGNRGGFNPKSGNVLEATVQSGSAIPRKDSDAATGQFQNPMTTEQYKKFSKTLLPEFVSSKFLFDTLGWAKVPGKLEGAAQKMSDWVQDNSPGAARVASWINSHFGLQTATRDALVQAKDDRRGGSMIYEQMAKYFTDLPPQQSVAVLEYMDAKLASLRGQKPAPKFPTDDTILKDLADATIEKWWEYAKALREPKQRDAYAGTEGEGGKWRGGVNFSQGLAFAENVGQLASQSFGARNISQLISSRTKDEVNDDAIRFRPDENGDPVLTDQFVGLFKLTPALKKRLDNSKTKAEAAQILAELKPDEFMSAELLAKDGRPALAADGTQLIPDRNYLWDVKEKDKGGYRFTARLDAKQALQAKKGQDLGFALQNTMSILANSYSANRLTEALASYEPGTPNAVAFDNLDDLNAVLNGEYKNGAFVPNTQEASWTKKIKEGQVIKLSADEAKSERVKGLFRNRHQWVQLPDSPTYGALAGKVVNGSVWSAIEDMSDRRPLVNSAVYNGVMRWFKKSKTVYNPATWGTNVASNFTMAMMDDIPLPTIAYAAKLYAGYNMPKEMAASLGIKLSREQEQLMLEVMKTNALLGDFSSNEIKKSLYDAMRSTVGDSEQSVAERIMQFAKIEKDRIEAIKKMAGTGKDAAEKFDKLAGEWYSLQDNVFRVASMLNHLGKQAETGVKIDAEAYRKAGDHARFAFLDYDIDSKAVRIMRQTAFPFISWPYAAAKLVGNVALHKPWKLVNLYAGYWILDAMMQGLTGDDDDELRTAGPEWARDRLLFGMGPHTHVRVPFLGDSENPVYYNLGKYVVPSSFGEKVPNGFLGLSWWPSSVSPGGPFISAAIGLAGGVDPFNGKALSPPTADDWERLGDRLAYAQSLFAPNLPFLNARELAKAKDAFDQRTDRSENYASLYAARAMGLRFYDFNVQGALDAQDRAAKAIERDFKIEIGKLKNAQERLENPDWDAFYEREDELLKRMEERIAKVRGMAPEED